MNTIKGKLISVASAALCLAAAYALLEQPTHGALSWVLGLPAAAIVGITALVRANDLPHTVMSWRGHLRRTGFVFAGIGAVSFMLMPFGANGHWPSWEWVLMLYGVSGVWLTTPQMPPWWDYVTGQKKVFRRKNAKPNL